MAQGHTAPEVTPLDADRISADYYTAPRHRLVLQMSNICAGGVQRESWAGPAGGAPQEGPGILRCREGAKGPHLRERTPRRGARWIAKTTIRWRTPFQGIALEVSATHTPYTQRAEGLGVVLDGLARSRLMEFLQRFFHARQDPLKVADHFEAQPADPPLQVPLAHPGVTVSPRPASKAALLFPPAKILRDDIIEGIRTMHVRRRYKAVTDLPMLVLPPPRRPGTEAN